MEPYLGGCNRVVFGMMVPEGKPKMTGDDIEPVVGKARPDPARQFEGAQRLAFRKCNPIQRRGFAQDRDIESTVVAEQ